MVIDSVLTSYRKFTVLAVLAWTLLAALLHPGGGAATTPFDHVFGQQISHQHHHEVETDVWNAYEYQEPGTSDHTHEPLFLLPQCSSDERIYLACHTGGHRTGIPCFDQPVPERPPKSLMT